MDSILMLNLRSAPVAWALGSAQLLRSVAETECQACLAVLAFIIPSLSYLLCDLGDITNLCFFIHKIECKNIDLPRRVFM